MDFEKLLPAEVLGPVGKQLGPVAAQLGTSPAAVFVGITTTLLLGTIILLILLLCDRRASPAASGSGRTLTRARSDSSVAGMPDRLKAADINYTWRDHQKLRGFMAEVATAWRQPGNKGLRRLYADCLPDPTCQTDLGKAMLHFLVNYSWNVASISNAKLPPEFEDEATQLALRRCESPSKSHKFVAETLLVRELDKLWQLFEETSGGSKAGGSGGKKKKKGGSGGSGGGGGAEVERFFEFLESADGDTGDSGFDASLRLFGFCCYYAAQQHAVKLGDTRLHLAALKQFFILFDTALETIGTDYGPFADAAGVALGRLLLSNLSDAEDSVKDAVDALAALETQNQN
eukprot:m.481996 g.481996  ORF g.481996 m.481996 type:complete len:346 (-) comp22400_c0_seq1:654-1691(-)